MRLVDIPDGKPILKILFYVRFSNELLDLGYSDVFIALTIIADDTLKGESATKKKRKQKLPRLLFF